MTSIASSTRGKRDGSLVFGPPQQHQLEGQLEISVDDLTEPLGLARKEENGLLDTRQRALKMMLHVPAADRSGPPRDYVLKDHDAEPVVAVSCTFDVAIELQVKVLIFLGRRRQKLAKGKEPKRREEKGRVQEGPTKRPTRKQPPRCGCGNNSNNSSNSNSGGGGGGGGGSSTSTSTSTSSTSTSSTSTSTSSIADVVDLSDVSVFWAFPCLVDANPSTDDCVSLAASVQDMNVFGPIPFDSAIGTIVAYPNEEQPAPPGSLFSFPEPDGLRAGVGANDNRFGLSAEQLELTSSPFPAKTSISSNRSSSSTNNNDDDKDNNSVAEHEVAFSSLLLHHSML